MPGTDDTDRDLIREWVRDLRETAPEEFARYIAHCEINVDDAVVAHYQLPSGGYDVERAAMHMASFPPVAARIAARQAKKVEEAEADG